MSSAAVPETYNRFDYDKPRARDVFWILPYVAMALAILITGAREMGGDYSAMQWIGLVIQLAPASLLVPPIVVLFVMIIWIKVIEKFPKAAMIGSFGAFIVLLITYAILQLRAGSQGGCIAFLVIAALTGLYLAWNRKRIPFASTILGMAADALTDYSAVMWIGASFVPLMYFWFILMIFNIMPFVNAMSSSIAGAYFLWMFCFFYGVEVLKTIMHTTACGVAGTWYFFAEPKAPTMNALKRTMTTSFGSVCLGALVVSILEALLELTKATVGRCLICVVWCLEWIVKKFNNYAFVQVAIYGKSFFKGAVDTIELLFTKGLTVVINDSFFSIVLSASKTAGAILCAAIGYGVALREFQAAGSNLEILAWAVAIIQFYIGYGVSALLMNILYSYIITFLVCYCEDPVALNGSRPAYYQKLREALKETYQIDQVAAGSAPAAAATDSTAPPAYTGGTNLV